MLHRESVRFLSRLLLLSIALYSPVHAQSIGVGIHPNQDIAVINNALATANLSFRMDISWKLIETQKGVLTFPSNYAKFETMAETAAQRGTPALIILDYGNEFYGGGDSGGELPQTPDAVQGFANYANFLVSRFKGKVSLFEVYNEWNSNITSLAIPRVGGDANSYVSLLKATYGAIKAANPNAVVIGGVVGGTDTNWINHFIQAGGLAYLDAFSVHPYVYNHGTRPAAPSPLRLSWLQSANAVDVAPVTGTPEDAMAWIDKIKAAIDQAAPSRNIPVYVTEIGWPTSTGQSGVSEVAEDAYLQRFMFMAHARAWLAGVWWYDLIDGGSDPTVAENRFGLLRQNGEPKPSFTSLNSIMGLINFKLPASERVVDSQGVLVSGKTSSGGAFCAAWIATDNFRLLESSPEVSSLLSSSYKSVSGSPATSKIGATPSVLIQ